jgi:16S rRNA (guanine966-N2)-methyltransferase
MAGKLRGRTLTVPDTGHVRPTTGRVRQSLFDSLQLEIPGCRFLDLFAGSGVMGLEAYSRGASFVLAVEADRKQAQRLREQAERFGLGPEIYTVVQKSVEALLQHPPRDGEGFDIVFLDPPYGHPGLEAILRQLATYDWLRAGASVVLEQGSRDTLPFAAFAEVKSYGDTRVVFYTSPDEASTGEASTLLFRPPRLPD